MRVISKEYQAILDKSSAWNYIQNTPKPDFSELDKEVAKFERWIKKEHKKDRQLLREATRKWLLNFLSLIHTRDCLAKYVGVNSLYIYALPETRLIEYYKKLGFTRLPKKQEQFVQYHVKPQYDEGCVFMYQTL